MIKFPGIKQVEYVPNDDFMYQWCCTCGARHIWHFHIVRGKTPEDDYVAISVAGDPTATKLRKFYEKAMKKEVKNK